LRVRLLGRFDVLVNGRRVPDAAWRQRRAAALVKLLALEPSHRLHREQLMDALWPDFAPDAQANNLRQMLHHARRQLEAAGAPPGRVLARDGDMVMLAAGGTIWVDVQAFEQAITCAWQALSPATARAALDLYSGDLLPDDRYEDWVEPRRAALRASFLALLTRLCHLHVERGETSEAIGVLQRLVEVEPLQESAHVALMRLYAGAGQRELAVVQFDRLVSLLDRELAAGPEPDTIALAEAIRSGELPADELPHSSGFVAAGRQQPASPTTLPTPVSQLVGREQEIAEVRQLLATTRLVTLTGPGGIGKTRLAIAAAAAAAERFPEGVVFVDLASIRDPDLLVPAIAQTLDLREIADQPLIETVASSLRDKRRLLVLDNFEQIADAAPVVATLLERAGSVYAIVTSRVRLQLRGEREYPVQPLAVAAVDEAANGAGAPHAPATALFIERACEADPGFIATPDTLPTVAALCRHLDGLPLAIELAAARSRVLPPQALLERLDAAGSGRLSILSGGARDLPARQQTIRDTIQWSYDLLDPGEQALFRQLSVFVGGWTLAAAEAVVGLEPFTGSMLDGLGSLVDKNLIVQRRLTTGPDAGTPRFGMLETIRELGLEWLTESGDLQLLRDRHAAWWVAFAEQAAPHLEEADQALWLARLERDDANIRAALDWLRERRNVELGLRFVKALSQHWFIRGRLAEGAEQALNVAHLPESSRFPTLRIDVLNVAAYLAREHTDYQRAYEAGRESLTLSHQINDRKRAADALANLGYVALHQGNLDDARELFQRSLTTQRELGNQQGTADALAFLALTAFHREDFETACDLYDDALAIWTALDDRQAIAWVTAHLGYALTKAGHHPAAYERLTTSLATSRQLDFRAGVSWAFDGLIELAAVHDAPELAVRLAAAAVATREAAGILLLPRQQADTDRLLAELRAALDQETFAAAWSAGRAATVEELADAIHSLLDSWLSRPTPRVSWSSPHH
jgi:predicted ATPase/DNA-binding SARP family transcriptional activator